MSAKIVSLKPTKPYAAPRFPASVKRRSFNPEECTHEFVMVGEVDRRVTCRNDKCGATLDPATVLTNLAARWDRELWAINKARRVDDLAGLWLRRGGSISIGHSGVTVVLDGRRWASRVSGGITAQLESALDRAAREIKRSEDDAKRAERDAEWRDAPPAVQRTEPTDGSAS